MRKYVIYFCFPANRYKCLRDIIKNIHDEDIHINVYNDKGNIVIIDQPVGINIEEYEIVESLLISYDSFISNDICAYLGNPISNYIIEAQPRGNNYRNNVASFADYESIKYLNMIMDGSKMCFNDTAKCLYINISGVLKKNEYIEETIDVFLDVSDKKYVADYIEIDIDCDIAKVYLKEKKLINLFSRIKKPHN